MLKKTVGGTLILMLLLVPLCFAQVPRESTVPIEQDTGQTTLTNLGVNGYEAAGCPGYLRLTDTDGKDYYLYVMSGTLYITSGIEALASFPDGDWESGMGELNGTDPIVVGSQS